MNAVYPERLFDRQGFTLAELMMAMLIGGIIFLGAARFFPSLFQQSRRLQQQNQLNQELYQLLQGIEKKLRRAGYCQKAPCAGPALTLSPDRSCLIIRMQEWRKAADKGRAVLQNESYGYRWRDGQAETQRGVNACQGSGWEKLTDPATTRVEHLQFILQPPRAGIFIRMTGAGEVSAERQHWLLAENL